MIPDIVTQAQYRLAGKCTHCGKADMSEVHKFWDSDTVDVMGININECCTKCTLTVTDEYIQTIRKNYEDRYQSS